MIEIPRQLGLTKKLYSDDRLIGGLLFLFTAFSRIPFRTSMLYAWDSILYERALDNYDVTVYHPQPPGHIFYVGVVWLVNRLVGDPNAAMVWVSVLSSAAAVTALYWLGRNMFGRRAGLSAALLLATSLSFWAHSEVALPYTLLGCLSIVVAGLIYQAWRGRGSYVIPAALALGVASGFRQDLLPFMLPLLALGLAGFPIAKVSKAVLVLAAAIVSWYVPSALMSGGFSAYEEASSLQSSFLMHNSSVLGSDGAGALGTNLNHLARFFFWGASGALPVVGTFALALPWQWMRFRDRRLLFLAAWALPSIAFYMLIHIGELGYVFFFLPALLLAGVWGVEEIAGQLAARFASDRKGRILNRSFIWLPLFLVALNAAMFLFLSPKLSARSLAARDATLITRINGIRENFNPETTLILAVHDDQHISYYLPEYQHLGLDAMVRDNIHAALPPETKNVVIFDGYFRPAPDTDASSLPLSSGRQLDYIPSKPDRHFVYVDWDSMTVSLEK